MFERLRFLRDVDPAAPPAETPPVTPPPPVPEDPALVAERTARLAVEDKLKATEGQLAGDVSNIKTLLGALFAGAGKGAPAAPAPELTDEEFLTKPRASAQRVAAQTLEQFARGLAPILDRINDRQFAAERRHVESLHPKTFKLLEKDIDAYFAALPGERQRPGAVEEAYTYFLGKNHDAVVAAERGGLGSGPSPAPPTGPAAEPAKPKGPELSAEEERIAKRYGMTPERYAASRAGERPKKEAPKNG